MKLHDFPASIRRAFQLKRIDIDSLHSKDAPGVPIIVSLTSIPSRFHVVHLTVRSILSGTHKPELIVLWLHESQRECIPKSLARMVGEKFEIRYVTEDCPHLKLVYSLQAFPNKLIVTCDDDLMYDPHWLYAIYQEHLQHPEDIIANECRAVAYDEAGNIRPYYYWYKESKKNASYDAILPLGYAGVLYPPHCLHEDVCNSQLYLKLAPKADDLWFKAMALLKGTRARRALNPVAKPIPIFNSQAVSLKATNVKQDGNRLQWIALAQHYAIGAFPPLEPPTKTK